MTKAATLSLAFGMVGTLVPSVAWAHFTLDYPPSFMVDSDSSGTPQKAFPCAANATLELYDDVPGVLPGDGRSLGE
jgi:hypothetical protein